MRYCPECGFPKEHHRLVRVRTETGIHRQRMCLLTIAPDPDPRTGEMRKLPTVTADRAAYAEMAEV